MGCEGSELYKDITYESVKDRIAFAEANFSYGLMSMEDVELTHATTNEDQDAEDLLGIAKVVAQVGLGREAQGNGAESQRQKAITHIFREAKHPLGALWDWARRGENMGARYRRWRSLQYWATGRMNNPPPEYNDKPEKKAEWRERWNGNRKVYRKMKERVKAKIKAKQNDNDDDVSGSGTIVTLDGKPCPSWIAQRLVAARNAGWWDGVLVSGYRTPEYSEQLCYNICGRPSCPGLCAGRSSNHCCPPTYNGVAYTGACDLSYYWQWREGDHLINNLPRDLVHFSNSGY